MSSRTRAAEFPGAPVHAFAAALCLLAPVEVFLANNRYPLLAAEVLPLQAAPLVAGFAVFALAKLRRNWLSLAALWACLFLGIAFAYDIERLSHALLIAVASGACIAALGRNAAIVTLAAAALHVATTLGLRYAEVPLAMPRVQAGTLPAEGAARDLPPVLHLVLDEFAGPRGMPTGIPRVAAMASKVGKFFEERGFVLYSHAYSQYFDTTGSIPNLLNFSSSAASGAFVGGSGDRYAMRENAYFRHLAGLGYALHVYQSNYLNYCRTPGVAFATCTTYRANSVATIADAPMSTGQKARFIANSFMDSSEFLGKVRYAYLAAGRRLGIELPSWPSGNSRTGPLAVMRTVERLRKALGELRPGEAHFAHLMLPHYPYLLDAGCKVKPDIGDWLNLVPFEWTGRLDDRNTPATRRQRYEQYAAQVECTLGFVDGLFSAMKASGRWREAIVIVHGDHGSRLMRNAPRAANLGRLDEDDYRDAYSTLFASRRGTAPGATDASVLPLQALLARVWDLPAPAGASPTVFAMPLVDGEDHLPIALKGFGPAPGQEAAAGK